MKSTTTSKVIERFDEIFSRHGLPESLTSDNGPQFISSECKVYMDYQGIQHRKVTAERKDWKKELNVHLASYRSLPHPTTGVSPAELLFGRKVRTRLPELRDAHVELEVRDRNNEQKNR